MRRLAVMLVFWVTALWAGPAQACSCVMDGTCDAAWRADAVFVGHVVSIRSTSEGRLVQLAVLEGFRGFRLTQVEVTTPASEAACGYPFQLGESYLVYAHQSAGAGPLNASLCSRTRPVLSATDDLAYLRSIATIEPDSLARIAGRVMVYERGADGSREPPAMGGVTVVASGEGRTFSTKADASGNFVLTGLPVASYDLETRAPDGYASTSHRHQIHDPRGCGLVPLWVRHDNRVIGRVVDARGAGVGALPIDLVFRSDADKPEGGRSRVRARTAADGTFELELVEPGDYLLGFNFLRTVDNRPVTPRVFYPGVADASGAVAIAVASGQRVRLRDFVIPDGIRLVTVRGMVVDETGQPVGNASVGLSRDTESGGDSAAPPLVTGNDGRFVFTIAEGGRYVVHVSRTVGTARTRETQSASHRFVAASGLAEVTIVLQPRAR